MTFTACSPRDARCEQFAACTVRDPLWRVRDQILSVLQTITIADIDDGGHRRVSLTIHREDPDVSGPVQVR